MVSDGTLRGTGPNADLKHWLDVASDMTVSFRVRIEDGPAQGSLAVYRDAEREVVVDFGSPGEAGETPMIPIDNIIAVLGTARDPNSGYRLEINAANRSRTILFRNGESVAEVAQDASFPIQYVGGHSPYRQRRLRVALVKEGATVYGYVGGRQVLKFTDPNPLEIESVGLGGHETRANFSHIAIRELASR